MLILLPIKRERNGLLKMKNDYSFEAFKKAFPKLFEQGVRCGFSLPKGWGPIVWKLCENLDSVEHRNVPLVIEQVKSKFGGLRFYTKGETKEDAYHIKHIEYTSYLVCMSCGTTERVSEDLDEWGGGRSFCPPCNEERKNRM